MFVVALEGTAPSSFSPFSLFFVFLFFLVVLILCGAMVAFERHEGRSVRGRHPKLNRLVAGCRGGSALQHIFTSSGRVIISFRLTL